MIFCSTCPELYDHACGQAALPLLASAELRRQPEGFLQTPTAKVGVVPLPSQLALGPMQPLLSFTCGRFGAAKLGGRVACRGPGLLDRFEEGQPLGGDRLQFVARAQKGFHAHLPPTGCMDSAVKDLAPSVDQAVRSPAGSDVGPTQPHVADQDGGGRQETAKGGHDLRRAAYELPQVPGSPRPRRPRALRGGSCAEPVEHDGLQDVFALKDQPNIVGRPEHHRLRQGTESGRHGPLVSVLHLDHLGEKPAIRTASHQVAGPVRGAFPAGHQILEHRLPCVYAGQRFGHRRLPLAGLGAPRPRGLAGRSGGARLRFGRRTASSAARSASSCPAVSASSAALRAAVSSTSACNSASIRCRASISRRRNSRSCSARARVVSISNAASFKSSSAAAAARNSAERRIQARFKRLAPAPDALEPTLVGGPFGHLGEPLRERIDVVTGGLEAPTGAFEVRLDAGHALTQRGGLALQLLGFDRQPVIEGAYSFPLFKSRGESILFCGPLPAKTGQLRFHAGAFPLQRLEFGLRQAR